MCFLFALTIPTEMCLANTNSVTANKSFGKAPKLKTGNNKIIVPITYPDDEDVYNAKFVAPKSGTYQIKIQGIKSALTKYPTARVILYKAETTKIPFNKYTKADFDNNDFWDNWAILMSTNQSVGTYYEYNFGYRYSMKGDIYLKKGNVLLFRAINYHIMKNGHTDQIRQNGNLSFKVKIKPIEKDVQESSETEDVKQQDKSQLVQPIYFEEDSEE